MACSRWPTGRCGRSATIAVLLAAARPDLVTRIAVAEPCLRAGGGVFSGWVAQQEEHDYVSADHRIALARFRTLDRTFHATLRMASPLAIHRSSVSMIEQCARGLSATFTALPQRRSYHVGELSLPDRSAEDAQAAGIPVRVVRRAGHRMMTDAPEAFAATLADSLS